MFRKKSKQVKLDRDADIFLHFILLLPSWAAAVTENLMALNPAVSLSLARCV